MTEKFAFHFEIEPSITADEIDDKVSETLRLLNEEYGGNNPKTNIDELTVPRNLSRDKRQ